METLSINIYIYFTPENVNLGNISKLQQTVLTSKFRKHLQTIQGEAFLLFWVRQREGKAMIYLHEHLSCQQDIIFENSGL